MITSFGYICINPIFCSKITLYRVFVVESLHKLIKIMDKNNLNKTVINSLFSGLCCSQCKNDFSVNSFKILQKEGDILICNLTCEKCGKDFGEILLNLNHKAGKHAPLEIIEGPPPISVDDVLDAHKFIKDNL